MVSEPSGLFERTWHDLTCASGGFLWSRRMDESGERLEVGKLI